MSESLTAGDLTWLEGAAPAPGEDYSAKTRYRQADAGCRIVSIDADRCEVAFQQAQWAVTPGQSLVAYAGDVCLGGGIIT